MRVGAAVGQGTNNEAEYHALLAGMRHALKLGLFNVTAFSDSLLVTNQMNDLWRVRKGRLSQLHREAKNLSRLFHHFNVDYVPREYNTDADELSRIDVFEEPTLPPVDRFTDLQFEGPALFKRALYGWQAAAIRVWWLNHHPGAGTLSRIFGISEQAIEQIGYGKSYRNADFAGYEDHIRSLTLES